MPKIPRVSVSVAAYSSVKQVLLSSKYAPGARVDIEELCRELDVSRTPIFDALNRLEAEGLVEILPRKGVYLVTLSEEKARELYEVREILEARATRLAATNVTEKQLEQLKRVLDKQASCLANDDAQGYASATIKFHNVIIEAAGNKTLERILNAVHSQMEALRLRTLYLPTRLRQSFAEHKRIFEALSKRDPERCERAAREHILATTEYALQLLRRSESERTNKTAAQISA